MKKMIQNAAFKLSGLVASMAFLLAVSSVGNTCVFMTYQPDVPEELQ